MTFSLGFCLKQFGYGLHPSIFHDLHFSAVLLTQFMQIIIDKEIDLKYFIELEKML